MIYAISTKGTIIKDYQYNHIKVLENISQNQNFDLFKTFDNVNFNSICLKIADLPVMKLINKIT